ncbi:MAG: ferric-rhodotorulic acid/ferric-coprogen receptor FhuE, partial [Stenotrophomonas sp.]
MSFRPTLPQPALLAAALSVALCSAAASAWAEEAAPAATNLDAVKVVADADIPTSYTVKQARTATKLDLSLRHTPQSVTVLTRQR